MNPMNNMATINSVQYFHIDHTDTTKLYEKNTMCFHKTSYFIYTHLMIPTKPVMNPSVGGQLLSQSVSSSLGLRLAILYIHTLLIASDIKLTVCQPLE